jgi:DNA-binding MarR family transcriptional regulator
MSKALENDNEDIRYSSLKLRNQLCFPIYACSRVVVNNYRHLLRRIKLTYTQYITMMVLWEYKSLSLTEIGNYLFLDSGTLTPVLKQLEEQNYIKRKQSRVDKRSIIFSITEKGERLKEKALTIPPDIAMEMNLTSGEATQLYNLLYKVMGGKTLEEANEGKYYKRQK